MMSETHAYLELAYYVSVIALIPLIWKLFFKFGGKVTKKYLDSKIK